MENTNLFNIYSNYIMNNKQTIQLQKLNIKIDKIFDKTNDRVLYRDLINTVVRFERKELNLKSINQLIKNKLNVYKQNEKAAMIADKLNISVGDPILFRKRVVCDPGDRPIEYNLGYYRADSFTYTIDIAKD